MTKYIVISEDELEIKKGEIFLGTNDVQELLEYRDVFLKFLDKSIHSIQADLANCKMVGKENEAYVSINTVLKLKKSLEDLEKTYKEHTDKKKK